LIYIGAGTSGRLGVLDAAECPPTFGSDPEQVIGIIAGGKEAVFISREGIEDECETGEQALAEINLTTHDTVIGIASSGRTPYVLSALNCAGKIGASTGFLVCNPQTDVKGIADVIIATDVGPEVIMGSTRLKSGTATKLILNMISSAAFIRSGKVYRGMMVDLKAWSEKLKARSRRVLMLAADLDFEEAGELLYQADGHVKTAIVMALCNLGKEEAENQLDRSRGFVRKAIEDKQNPENSNAD